MTHQPRRVFVGSIATETNTFSPLRTDIQDFHEGFYAPAGEHPNTPTLCSAVFPVAREHAAQYNWTLIEGTATWAEPGGVVNQETWTFLRDQLLAELTEAMPVDIVLLGLHGAMVAQECLDCEGELLEKVRTLVGPGVHIAATLDPHSHLSQKRLDNADLLIAFKEFPHTDFVDTAESLITLVHRTVEGDVQPVMSTFDCRMIEILPTSREPMRSFVDRMKAMEGHDNVLSLSVIHGFMAGDVPDMGTRMLVITDNDTSMGDALVTSLGTELFGYRGKTRPEFLDSHCALDKVLQETAGNVVRTAPHVIADVWDNPGGGVPGDSTLLLQACLDKGMTNMALATIWDPIAVRLCFSAGLGACFPLRFGGKVSHTGGDPMDAMVTVKHLQRKATQSFGTSIVSLGDAACIEFEGIEVILNTARTQVYNPDIFSNMGIDPMAKALLVVKSTNHFAAAFAPIAASILYVAVEGPYPSKPEINAYQHLNRDLWPRCADPFGVNK